MKVVIGETKKKHIVSFVFTQIKNYKKRLHFRFRYCIQVVNQPYSAKVFEEDVIRGNAAIFKCSTPTFVGDFLSVESWFQDDVPILKNDKYGIYAAIKWNRA